jgi:hypothetical protein
VVGRNRRAARVSEPPAPPSFPVVQRTGRLRYDTLASGRTRILPTWLITTSDRHVAVRIATLRAATLARKVSKTLSGVLKVQQEALTTGSLGNVWAFSSPSNSAATSNSWRGGSLVSAASAASRCFLGAA